MANSLATLLVVAVGVVLIGPILLLALFSFNDSSVIALPFEGFTLEWYQEALSDPVRSCALVHSLVLAAVVAPVCVVLGTAHGLGDSPGSGSRGVLASRDSSARHWSCRGSSSVSQAAAVRLT